MYLCNKCGKSYTRESSLKRHSRESCSVEIPQAKRPRIDGEAGPSTSNNVTCNCCNKTIPSSAQISHRRTLEHRTNACVEYIPNVQLTESAFKGRIASYRVESENRCTDYNSFFSSTKNTITQLLEEMRRLHNMVKVNMELFARYTLLSEERNDIKSFHTPNKVIDGATDLNDTLEMFTDLLKVQTSEFQERDSGWALEYIMYIEVNVNKFSSVGGSSYIKLPKQIQNKRAVINVYNQDECCFLWAIMSALYPVANRSSEISSYPHYSTVLDIEGMTFPVKLRDIPKFESRNNISIHVYGLEKNFSNGKMNYEVVGPLYYSQKKMPTHVNLLLITSDCGNSHYCWIKNLSGLVSSQISNSKCKRYFCDGCLLYFNSEILLVRHQQNDCNHLYTVTPSNEIKNDKFGLETPENILKFKNYEKKMEVPFVVYADFESVLEPIATCEPNPQYSYTNKTFIHKAYSFAYLIKCSFDESLSKFEIYRGVDAATVFVEKLESDLTRIYNNHLKPIVPMQRLSADEEAKYKNASICGICEKPFQKDSVRVKDHDHITGKFRFAAHSICNIHYKIPNFIPIIFHNMSGYDCHMFIKQLCSDNNSVDVIAQSKEKYISFTKYLHVDNYVDQKGRSKKKYLKIRFIDSFKFMASSLQTLGENLEEGLFYETKRYFPDDSKFKLMRKKGVFPYSFVDNLDKLNNEYLPLKEQFYDNLNEKHITDADYARAQEVWNSFGCRTLGEYSDIYLTSDVLLLCDVFQNFRQICLTKYKLDPAQYFTAPGLSWDAMLKYTNVELELLTDIDMVHMLKNGIRGGISQCSERKHIANNKFLPNYNPDEPSSFINYVDATNLYGASMSKMLPTGGFSWLSECEIEHFNVKEIPENSPEGFILEVDVHYPPSLQDCHSDLPFLVENMIPPNSKSKFKKLIPNLNDKLNYVVHYKNLQQAIENGLVLTKIHRILKFNQSCWLKKYIDLNTDMRNRAKNKFERDFYKLMNNSVFGKTLENVDKRKDIRLITHWDKIGNKLGAKVLIARPNFKTCSIFTENFVAVHMGMLKVIYNKPIYVGFAILELSKTILYDFFYNVIKKEFGNNASLLYTDTDSLIIKTYTDNFYKFIIDNLDKFDTSNYKPDNKFNIPVNKSMLGKMKDEFPGDPIICFLGTGAKAYYVQSLENELKKAKGIKKSVIKQHINIDDYRKIVESGGLLFRKMNTFTTHLHDMYTEMKNKVALSHNDDKRFVIPNTTKTLAWGHADIDFYQTSPEQNLRWLRNALNEVEAIENEPFTSGDILNFNSKDFFSARSSAEQNLEALMAAIDELSESIGDILDNADTGKTHT